MISGRSFIPAILIMIFFLVVPAHAAFTTISQGGAVFIGEQGLDITAAMGGDSKIGWWASGAAITTSSPDATIVISNPASFFISPSDFGSHLGPWYHLDATGKSKGAAFTVLDPNLALRVEDTTVNADVTNRWVPTGDEIQFRIDTNLIPISQRGGGLVPITIKVNAPGGGQYSALIDKAGNPQSLDQLVGVSPFTTGAIWYTGNRNAYAPGTYTIWAECTVNSMKDNYPVTGKTISSQISLLNQDQNPLISGNYPTMATVPVTTIPVTTIPVTTGVVTTKITIPTISPAITMTQTSSPTESLPITTPNSTPSPSQGTPVTKLTTPVTYSPGFEVPTVCFAVLIVLFLILRKN